MFMKVIEPSLLNRGFPPIGPDHVGPIAAVCILLHIGMAIKTAGWLSSGFARFSYPDPSHV